MGKMFVVLAVFLAFLGISYAQNCDYSLQIDSDYEFSPENFSFRILAVKEEGTATNISSYAAIKKDGRIIKEYFPWKNEAITRQKTSQKYSPNLLEGEYEISANISVDCDDLKLSNNFAEEKFVVFGNFQNEEKAKSLSKVQNESKEVSGYDNYIYSKEANEENSGEFRSSNEKSKKIAVYIFGFAMIVLAVILMLKKKLR